MGRFMRWLKQLLTGRKESRRVLEENRVASDWHDGPEKEKKRWSFAKQRRSGTDISGPPSGHQAAVAAAAESPSPLVKSFRRRGEEEDVWVREERAAVLIQKTFRGYLLQQRVFCYFLRSFLLVTVLVKWTSLLFHMMSHPLSMMDSLQLFVNSCTVRSTASNLHVDQQTPLISQLSCWQVTSARSRVSYWRHRVARKALRALRSLVKIQALVRGYLVRKQTAMALRRLQTLVRLQADSIAVKNASYRRSMEQVRISERDQPRLNNPPSTPVHRRRLSDSTDSNYERSPRIVEMDTCHLRSRSSRISSRYTPDPSTTEYHHRPTAAQASCSPLPGKLQPARLSFRRSSHERDHRERDPRGSKTAHSTPRFGTAQHQQPYDSPAKSVVEYGGYGINTTPRRTLHRDAIVSPRYMAGTASSAARTRCHSAPRQRQQATASSPAESRRAGSRRSCPHAHGGVCTQCSDASRRAGCSDLSADDEAAAREYYLDTLW